MLLYSLPVQAATEPRSPVVVELFESQGCSSCPPAESVINAIHEKWGTQVIPLIFHVDYWDYLGWKDTFSDRRWTDRQTRYGQAFNQNSIYTPEMVVQGSDGFVGSDDVQAFEKIGLAISQSGPALGLTIKAVGPSYRVTVQWSKDQPPNARHLIAVIYEDAPSVAVLRGENRGRTMSGDFVVRDMKDIPVSSGSPIVFTWPQNALWNATRARLAVFLTSDNPGILASASQHFP